MNSAIKWRIVSLQAFLVVVLAGAAVFAYGLGTFTTSQIRDELTAQQVYFPGADQIKAAGALDPRSSRRRSATRRATRSPTATRPGSTPTTSSASTFRVSPTA